MYSRILIPIAFEGEAEDQRALDVARALSASGAEVTLLHVIEEIPAYVANHLPEDYSKNALRAIHNDLEARAATFPKAQVRVVSGHAARAIVDHATAHNMDLVVMASHRPGLVDYFLGSTAAFVVRHATCAVHVLR